VNRFHLLPAALLAAGSIFSASAQSLTVTVHNELAFARPSETVELTAVQLAPLGNDLTRIRVYERGSAREVLAQALDLDGNGTHESLIFQTDLPSRGSRAFDLKAGEKRVYKRDDFRVYGRFNRERFDDFAWENDRVAHRMYGPALETWEKEPLTSSTVDVWLKRTRRLVLNDWYLVDDYHRDTGEGADFYSAGRSRGCGGSGLWRDGKLAVSKNFRESRVLANGPIRLVFELRYPDLGETKRITLDAGQNFNRFESRYDDAADTTFAAGIKKVPAAQFRIDRANGVIRNWEPVAQNAGEFGCAVIVAPGSIVDIVEAEGNQLVVAKTPAVYWVGSAWNRSGDFIEAGDFDRLIDQWIARVRSPVRIEIQ
jgi:unsaturated rhamnogalacturonyl hydrolase